MNTEVLMALIALVSGGSLTAVVKVILDRGKTKREEREKDIDDRILAWQKISDKNEGRIELLERKLDSYDRDFRSLERYIAALEQTILRAGVAELPERPVLEREVSPSN